MKLGSLFDGIGGWQFAAIHADITLVWSSEIEKFPLAVTAKHFPNTRQLGDITKVNGAEIEPVDIICMGSPCQDLSVAGKREGLAGARSGLFMEAIRIVREMREDTNGKYPRFVVWENVPGAFSSNKGADFRTVLEEITETEIPMPTSGRWATAGMVRSSKCEVAWRVLDAQFWGVPQRRKRIFLVADFGGQCAGEILFKPESVCWYSAAGCGEGQRVAGNTQNSPRAASGGVDMYNQAFLPELAQTLRAGNGGDSTPTVMVNHKVRRLTPTECERLQGLPDGYTLIDDKKCSDSSRYKALGNGMAQPCPDFVMEGIADVANGLLL